MFHYDNDDNDDNDGNDGNEDNDGNDVSSWLFPGLSYEWHRHFHPSSLLIAQIFILFIKDNKMLDVSKY